MSPTLTTFLYEAANFLVLAGLLGWLFFEPVRRSLAHYRSFIDAATQAAQQKLADAEQLQTQMQAERKSLQAELNQLRSRELQAARQQAEQILTEARAAAQRLRETMLQQASQLNASESERLSQAVAAAAGQLVSRLLADIGGPDLDAALLRAACGQLRGLPQDRFAPVTVESARRLSPGDRQVLEAALGPAAAATTFQVVEQLGAGLRISTGSGLVDATAGGLGTFAGQAIGRQLNQRNNARPAALPRVADG